MADDSPSAASHASVLNNIISAIMHLVSASPTGAPAASAALQAAHREITSWSPPIEAPPAPPEQWQANAPDAATGASLPNPADPRTESDGDGPPASNDLADEPSLDPTQQPAG